MTWQATAQTLLCCSACSLCAATDEQMCCSPDRVTIRDWLQQLASYCLGSACIDCRLSPWQRQHCTTNSVVWVYSALLKSAMAKDTGDHSTLKSSTAMAMPVVPPLLSGHSNYQIGPNRRYPLSYLDTLLAITPSYMYKVDVWPILNNTNTEYTSAELIEHW